MDNDIKYYVVEGWANANPEKKLKSNIRIVAISKDFPFFPSIYKGYNSLRDLRRNNPIWKQLKQHSSKTADKICNENFILDCYDFVLTPMDNTFNEYSFDLLQHTIHGNYDKNFQGLHLICDFNKNIRNIEELRAENEHGIWEARITVYNQLRDNCFEKVSTFFPKHWTPTHFMFEAYSAIKSLDITPTTTEYDSITKSGIPVKIIVQDNRVKTIYPKYIETKVT
jgi:hypothetical protein